MGIAKNLLLFFVFVQLIGLVTTDVISNDIMKGVYSPKSIANVEETLLPILFTMYVIIGSFILYLLLRYFSETIIMKLVELTTVTLASSFVFYAFFRFFLFPYLAIEYALIASVFLGLTKTFFNRANNVSVLISCAGVGALFGLTLGMGSALLIAVFLCVYDFFSVYISGHMKYLASKIMEQQLPLAVSVKGKEDGEEVQLTLGSGDFIVATMIVTSAYVAYGLEMAIVLLSGSLVGLMLVVDLLFSKKTVFPALPLIIFGMVLSFAVYSLF